MPAVRRASYLTKASFDVGGQSRQADLYCEESLDASPAGCDCAHAVVTKHLVIVPSCRNLH
jgi:hypothetical protein